MLELGEIEISDMCQRWFCRIKASLNRYSIFYCNNEKSADSKNKRYNCRNDLWELPSVTISQYLSDKLNFSYGYITIFYWKHLFFNWEFYHNSKNRACQKS
jgi:hypothetical protein